MKQGKSPTKAQKIRMKLLGLFPENWLISKNTPTEFVVVHRVSGEVRKLKISKEKAPAPTEAVKENSHFDCTIDLSKVEDLLDPRYLERILEERRSKNGKLSI